MRGTILLLSLIVIWYLLQKFILPRMGISTWLKPSSRTADKKNGKGQPDDKDAG